jgi:hypothetical protein
MIRDGSRITKDYFFTGVKDTSIFNVRTDSILLCSETNITKSYKIFPAKFPKSANRLVEKLMLDNNIDELKATDLFYNSDTFTELADEVRNFMKSRDMKFMRNWRKSWKQ